MDLLSKEENRPYRAHAASGGAAETATSLRALLETSLDRVLHALGLEMGTIWLHPHRVTRGLSEKVVEIGKAAAQAGLSIPRVQAVPDWQKVEETHPGLAPLADVMGSLGIRASIAVSLQHEDRTGGLAVAASQPRAWTGTEIALVETAAHLLKAAIESLRAEEERRKVNRALKVLGKCNEAVVRAADETLLLRDVCHLLVEDGGYRLAWVGFAEQDAAKTVRPVAQAGFEEGYLDTVNITWEDSERGRGPTGTAIRTGQPAVVRNMLTDPAYTPWREEATRRGYASSIALPLTAGGQTFGALNIYAAEPDAFAPDEVELLRRLADNLAFGIQALRARSALQESEAKYRTLVEQAPDGIFLADAEGRFVDVNPRGCALLRYTRDEILQLSIQDLIPPEDLAAQAIRFDELRSRKPILVKRRLRSKDGSVVPVEITARMLDNGLLQGIVRDVTERKQMEEEIRRQAARAEALLRTASRLNAQLDLGRVLQVVCEETRAALHVPAAAVLLHDDRRDALNLAADSGLAPGLAERMRPLPQALYEAYVRQGDPVVLISDLRAIPDQLVADLCVDYNLRTAVGVRMQRDGHFIGVLTLITPGEVRHFTAEELALLQGLADQAAQAITNARLFEGTRRRLKLVQALRNIDLAITGSLDLRVTFSVVLDEITAQLDLDAAAILLFNLHTQTLEYAAWRGFRTAAIRRLRLRLGEGYAGRAALERRTIYIPFLPESARDSV